MRPSVLKNTPPRVPSWEELRPRVTPALLRGIVARVCAAVQPELIILFGSQAYGNPGPDSDVDLFVVMKSRERMTDRIVRVARAAEVPFLPMDVLVYTPGEIRARTRLGDPFVAEVLARGKVLYRRGTHRRLGRKGRS